MWKKSSLRALLFTSLVVLFIIGGFNWAIDPMIKYRKNESLSYLFTIGKERFLNFGIAKNFSYKTVVIGTSMTENFLLSDVEKLLNTKAIKVPFSGGTAKEFSILLDFILKQQKAETIIYALDIPSYRNMNTSSGFRTDMPFENYSFMLKDDLFSEIKYLLNLDTFKWSLSVLKNTINNEDPNKNYNNAFMWFTKYKFGESEVLKNWNSMDVNPKLKENFKSTDYSFDDLKINFDELLYKHIVNNPKIKFIIFYPPYSYLTWKLADKRGSLDACIKFKEYSLNRLVMQPNVELYDFQQDEYIYNLNNYKDISHYSEKINHFIIEKIASKENLLTLQNLDSHLARLRAEREKWRSSHPVDVAEIEALKRHENQILLHRPII